MAYGQPFYTYPNAGYVPYQPQSYGNYQPQPQMPFVAQNQPLNAFQQQQGQMAQPAMQQPTQSIIMPPKSNKIYVTGLEDAMSRVAEPNTEMEYRHQDKQIIYEVYTDLQGKKTVKEYHYEESTSEPKQEEKISLDEYVKKEDFIKFATNSVTKTDLTDLESKFTQLLKQATANKPKKQIDTVADKGE